MLQLFRNRLATPAFFESTIEPWSDLRREIDRVFDSVLSEGRPATFNGNPRWMPPMDVEELDDRIRLSVEVPGVEPKDVSINVDNGVLTISGEKKLSRADDVQENGGGHIFECRYGRFERSLTLPQYIDADKAAAQYKNGVLTLELPKSAQSRRKKIEIGVVDGPKQIESGEVHVKK